MPSTACSFCKIADPEDQYVAANKDDPRSAVICSRCICLCVIILAEKAGGSTPRLYGDEPPSASEEGTGPATDPELVAALKASLRPTKKTRGRR